jgi:hypothetical protein
MAHFVDGIGHDDAATGRQISRLFARAAITTPAELRTWVVSGTLPAGATIGQAVFARALAALGAGARFVGLTADESADVGGP